MSKQQAKNIFEDGKTKWTSKTMRDFIDIVYKDLDEVDDRTQPQTEYREEFLNGWHSPIGSWSAPRIDVENGRVYMSGLITGGTDNRIMVLPERLRPVKAHIFVVPQAAGSVTIRVSNSGEVHLVPSSPGRTNVFLNGITYRLD